MLYYKYIRVLHRPTNEPLPTILDEHRSDRIISGRDQFYKEARIIAYHFGWLLACVRQTSHAHICAGDSFRGLYQVDGSGSWAQLAWKGRFAPFIDAMSQQQLAHVRSLSLCRFSAFLQVRTRNFIYLPSWMRSLKIDGRRHKHAVQKATEKDEFGNPLLECDLLPLVLLSLSISGP